MTEARRDKRVILYSHDSFGLGHLRRCRRIAHHLVGRRQGLSILIISGSSIIGSFDFRVRVDFVRIPGVIKMRSGEYTPLNLHQNIEETLNLRASIIQHTAEVFDPDLVVVDKEPLGLRGEMQGTLAMLKERGTPMVLGLRDILDDPQTLQTEWERKNAIPALTAFYDEIWVYGLREGHDPLYGLDLPAGVAEKTVFTGYLASIVSDAPSYNITIPFNDRPFILVTPGGGGDGESMVDWVLSAYESGQSIPYPALVVCGPFMAPESKVAFADRIGRLPNVEWIEFHNNMEQLMAQAAGVVAMGGYNTFCEILSFDKPSLIVPRTVPRLEQYIRAAWAEERGLVSMIDDRDGGEPERMVRALNSLATQRRPSEESIPGILDGLDTIGTLVDRYLDADDIVKNNRSRASA